jgi:hypothetical protein
LKLIKPPYLPIPAIVDKADEFRLQYAHPTNQIPLDLETIIEIQLRIRIEPRNNLSRILHKSGLAIDAFLTSDRTTILVDEEQYMLDQGRLKFTLAHEVGHWYLHEATYTQMRFSSIPDFLTQQKRLDDDVRKKFELQANVFASNLLVPQDQLITLTEKIFPEIYCLAKQEETDSIGGITSLLAEELSVSFGVSAEMVQNRLYTERIVDKLIPYK